MHAFRLSLLVLPILTLLAADTKPAAKPALHTIAKSAAPKTSLTEEYCTACHSDALKTGGISLEGLNLAKLGQLGPASHDTATWERVLRKLRTGTMPPPGMPRPDDATLATYLKTLGTALDREATLHPNPGAPMPHRLNRIEFSNAIRDLLAVDTKPGLSLPVDDSGNGFDNMADLLSMSPVLLERYLSIAHDVSRLAVGDLKMTSRTAVYGSLSAKAGPKRDAAATPPPFGAKDGLAFQHYFPLDGEYTIRVALNGSNETAVSPYTVTIPVKAGLHSISAAFLTESAKAETVPGGGGRGNGGGGAAGRSGGVIANVTTAKLDLRMDGVELKRFDAQNTTADVGTGTVIGPTKITGRGDTASRAKIFVCKPASAALETTCAHDILANLTHHAFRRPGTEADIRPLMAFYTNARKTADFDTGIQAAIEALLVSPDFLFRTERDPAGAKPGTVYRVSDLDLASRLSFFVWSSIPDDQLLKVAEAGTLHTPLVLKVQLKRMLEDPKSDALIENFGSQWLFLRTLSNSRPDADIFATFDENLRAAFRQETTLFLKSIFREDHSVLDLLDANYTFLNQRLAEHYGIPNVYGSHYRRVTLTDPNRGGLLGQGSVLTVTSYPNRTSVVQRGKWVLENLLGTPPPPPPPDVPELKPTAGDGRHLTLREAMEKHRNNPICAGCHSRMDPIGFALENFDGIGAWRSDDHGSAIDNTGTLPDGSSFKGPGELKKALLKDHKDEFLATMTGKLMTYALGRGLESSDQPVLRTIVKKAQPQNYKMSALISEIVESGPFQMRRTADK